MANPAVVSYIDPRAEMSVAQIEFESSPGISMHHATVRHVAAFGLIACATAVAFGDTRLNLPKAKAQATVPDGWTLTQQADGVPTAESTSYLLRRDHASPGSGVILLILTPTAPMYHTSFALDHIERLTRQRFDHQFQRDWHEAGNGLITVLDMPTRYIIAEGTLRKVDVEIRQVALFGFRPTLLLHAELTTTPDAWEADWATYRAFISSIRPAARATPSTQPAAVDPNASARSE